MYLLFTAQFDVLNSSGNLGAVPEHIQNDRSSGRQTAIDKLILSKLSDVRAMVENVAKKFECGLALLNEQIVNLREEVKLVKKEIKRKEISSSNESTFTVESTLPPLPLKSLDEIEAVENIIKTDSIEGKNLTTRLIIFGGANARGVINSLMNGLMTREMAMKFSLKGKSGKKSFKDLNLYSCILGKYFYYNSLSKFIKFYINRILLIIYHSFIYILQMLWPRIHTARSYIHKMLEK